MELIVVILIFVLVIANSNGKKKKGKAPAGQQGGNPRRNGTKVTLSGALREAMKEAVEDISGSVLSETPEEIELEGSPAVPRKTQTVAVASMPEEGRSMLMKDGECEGGSMPHVHTEGHSALEDEDCVGGSMEHTHTEGVSRAAQARRMAAIDAVHDDDILPRTIDARALRRAVVMAEVLGKPRALRKSL